MTEGEHFEAQLGRRHVLLVDDEPAITRMLSRRLEQLGYAVSATSTGEAAIQLASERHVDVVVMDVHLAGSMSGVDAARAIWATHRAPIVFLTGDESASVNPEGMRSRVLLKPVRAQELHDALEHSLTLRD